MTTAGGDETSTAGGDETTTNAEDAENVYS